MKISYKEALEVQTSYSAKGNQSKYHIDNKWIKIDYLGYEAAAEYICSKILKHSNIENYVQYKIDNIEIERRTEVISQKIGCISDNFLNNGVELITLSQLLDKHNISFDKLIKGGTKEGIQNVVNFVEDKLHIENYGKYLTALLEFDALTLNEDRHINNIIFLCKDGQYIPGPFFDNGAAFLSDTSQDYPLDANPREMMRHVKAKPFSTSFEKQVTACHELYGKQLKIKDFPIENSLQEVNKYYDNRISRRINTIYQIQKERYKELIEEKKIKTIEYER